MNTQILRNKNTQWLISLFLAICFMLVMSIRIIGMGYGGLISEKLIARNGTTNSHLVISRSGTSNSDLDITMGAIVTTGSVTNPRFDSTTHATLNGNLTDLNGFPGATVWFEYGETTSFGHTTSTTAMAAIGTFTKEITGFHPVDTVYYRAVVQTDGINYGTTQTFRLSRLQALASSYGIIYLAIPAILIMIIVGAILITKNPIAIVFVIGICVLVWFATQAMLNGMWR